MITSTASRLDCDDDSTIEEVPERFRAEAKFVKTSEAVNMDVAAFKFLQAADARGVQRGESEVQACARSCSLRVWPLFRDLFADVLVLTSVPVAGCRSLGTSCAHAPT